MHKAERPDGGEVYHGGCDGCVTPQHHCSKCCYFARPWSRPDYSSTNVISTTASVMTSYNACVSKLFKYVTEFILFSNVLVFIFLYLPATFNGDLKMQFETIAFISLSSNVLIYILLVKFRKHLKYPHQINSNKDSQNET